MVAHTCEYTKNHWIVHFKGVNYMVCGFYLYKAIQNSSSSGSSWFLACKSKILICVIELLATALKPHLRLCLP